MRSGLDLAGDPVGPADIRDESHPLDSLLLRSSSRVAQPQPLLGYGPGSRLFVSTSTIQNAGCGLFSNCVFMPGQTISLYDGVVVDKSVLGPVHDQPSGSFSHACRIKGTEYRVLGLTYVMRGRGLGSFANHNRTNNAKLESKTLKGR